MDIYGRVALITGAASGIGRAAALALAGVIVADVDDDGARETIDQLESAGGTAALIRTDVTSPADLDAAVAFAVRTYGGLDIVHNNAGIIVPARPFDEADRDAWMRMVAVGSVRTQVTDSADETGSRCRPPYAAASSEISRSQRARKSRRCSGSET